MQVNERKVAENALVAQSTALPMSCNTVANIPINNDTICRVTID